MTAIDSLWKAKDSAQSAGDEQEVNLLAVARYFEEWAYQGFLRKDWPRLGKRLKSENSQDVAQLLERARSFATGVYVFQNEWDMERTSVPEYFQIAELQWDHSPGGDPEWHYMLNRHAFLVDVALAYRLTLDASYLAYLEGFLTKWLADNPITPRTRQTSWRTIEAGLRVVNWIKVLEILTPLSVLSPRLLYDLSVSIDGHLAFLTAELSPSRSQSNWAIIEVTGIIIGALAFKELAQSTSYLTQALAYLRSAIGLQVEADGLQREQSFMYHHEVLICLLQIILIAERNELALEPFIEEQTLNMARASAHVIKPDGSQSNYGDSDSETMIGVLSVAETILKQPLLPVELVPEVSSLYEKLFVGLASPQLSGPRVTDLPSVAFENAGLYVMRGGHKDYSLFKCGPLGGGHGHDDLLHLEVYTQGRTVLVDSGRYSYEVKTHQRLAFKEAQAHNTLLVDGRNFNGHHGAWDTTQVATPVNQKLVVKDGAQFVEGGHLGYMDLVDPVFVNRKVIYLSDGIWFISDEISCQKAHAIKTSFHFPQPLVQRVSNQKVRFQDQAGLFDIEAMSPGKFAIETCEISFQYNQKVTSQRAVFEYQVTGNHSMTYLMSNQGAISYRKIPVGLDQETVLSDCEVECYSLTLPNGQSKYILIQHREPAQGRRAYYIEGNYVYGRISVVECESNGQHKRQVSLF